MKDTSVEVFSSKLVNVSIITVVVHMRPSVTLQKASELLASVAILENGRADPAKGPVGFNNMDCCLRA